MYRGGTSWKRTKSLHLGVDQPDIQIIINKIFRFWHERSVFQFVGTLANWYLNVPWNWNWKEVKQGQAGQEGRVESSGVKQGQVGPSGAKRDQAGPSGTKRCWFFAWRNILWDKKTFMGDSLVVSWLLIRLYQLSKPNLLFTPSKSELNWLR